ncbi:MAG TPA: tetratricopeptide repeat protein [Verrucomicrobiae bacterium]|jgi:hypothetical protein
MRQKFLLVLFVMMVVGIAAFVLIQKQRRPVMEQAATAVVLEPAPSPVDINALKNKAEAGDPAAQTRLGWIYERGNGVKRDMKEAVKWFQWAAEENYPEALATLGEMNQAGQGVSRDITNAVKLYRLAADKGSVAGQYNLAYLYEQGIGAEKNEVEASKWYEAAAAGGDPLAQYQIGQRYMLGVGVATNQVQACKWLALAMQQGQKDSKSLLSKLKSHMSRDEVAEATRLADNFHVTGSDVAAH